MTIVHLRPDQLSYFVENRPKEGVEVAIKVFASDEVREWLKNNLGNEGYDIEEKYVQVLDIRKFEDVIDAMTTLTVTFNNVEDAVKFKLVC
jgi:hypothetical protein